MGRDLAAGPWALPRGAPVPFKGSVEWAKVQAAGAQLRPPACVPDDGETIPEDGELLSLLYASAYTVKGHHRQTLNNAQGTGAAPSDIPTLLWICCQRLRPEHALLIGLGHYPRALPADPGTRAGGPLAPGTAAQTYQVERRPAEVLTTLN